MNEHSITYVAAKDLKVHPWNKALPAWADDDPRFLALCASIQECGIEVPLICDTQHQVIDGAHRLRAAKRVGLDELPVVIKTGDDVASTIVSTIVARKHYTKGQMAYICEPLFHDMFEEGKRRRSTSALPSVQPKSAEIMAGRLGISARLVAQARELLRIFAEDDAYKAHMEPQIMAADDPVGLGAAIAGYAGWKSTKGKTKPDKRDAEQLWLKGFNGLLFQTARLSDVKSLYPKINEALAECKDALELRRLDNLGKTIATAARRRLKELNKPR